MRLVNQVTAAEIVLPDSLLWEDEFNWKKVEGSVQWSISGALHFQTGTKQKGRPITLVPPDDSMAWVKKTVVDALMAASQDGTSLYNLFIGPTGSERVFSVRFRYPDTPVEARPVYRWQEVNDDAWYLATIRLIEV